MMRRLVERDEHATGRSRQYQHVNVASVLLSRCWYSRRGSRANVYSSIIRCVETSASTCRRKEVVTRWPASAPGDRDCLGARFRRTIWRNGAVLRHHQRSICIFMSSGRSAGLTMTCPHEVAPACSSIYSRKSQQRRQRDAESQMARLGIVRRPREFR